MYKPSGVTETNPQHSSSSGGGAIVVVVLKQESQYSICSILELEAT
jgi:hypothetical protein